jgi:hypothetical protein
MMLASGRPVLLEVTTDLANRWLATVNGNLYRPPAPSRVLRFAELMGSGNWLTDPQDPVYLDSRGNLRGGRMRLMGTVAAGKTIPLYVQHDTPVQEHEAIPSLYTGQDGKTVEAVRFNGTPEGYETVRNWMNIAPLNLKSVEYRDPATLVLNWNYDGYFAHLYAGNWLLRGPGNYHCYSWGFTSFYTKADQ